jgi:hypothetical protein
MEKTFIEYIECGNMAFVNGETNFHLHFLSAYKIFGDDDALYNLAKLYIEQNNYSFAHMYLKKCWHKDPILFHQIAYELHKINDLYLVIDHMNKNNITIPILNNNYTKDKLYLLVPYRDRKEQLDTFVPHMNKYLGVLQIDYEIVVIEQKRKGPFNKGILYNAGAKYINNLNNLNKNIYICFHDVDIIPNTWTNYFRPEINTVNHLYGYQFCLGGIFLMNIDTYTHINGFSLKYYGWGYEDNDLLRRITNSNVIINRNIFYERYNKECFIELDDDPIATSKKMNLPQTTINKQIFESNIDLKSDGLSQINKVIKKTKKYNINNYILITIT